MNFRSEYRSHKVTMLTHEWPRQHSCRDYVFRMFVCLFVCLCVHDNSKSSWFISMKFGKLVVGFT